MILTDKLNEYLNIRKTNESALTQLQNALGYNSARSASNAGTRTRLDECKQSARDALKMLCHAELIALITARRTSYYNSYYTTAINGAHDVWYTGVVCQNRHEENTPTWIANRLAEAAALLRTANDISKADWDTGLTVDITTHNFFGAQRGSRTWNNVSYPIVYSYRDSGGSGGIEIWRYGSPGNYQFSFVWIHEGFCNSPHVFPIFRVEAPYSSHPGNSTDASTLKCHVATPKFLQ
jgi:hypothetical protein